jgi:hypothetical protein
VSGAASTSMARSTQLLAGQAHQVRLHLAVVERLRRQRRRAPRRGRTVARRARVQAHQRVPQPALLGRQLQPQLAGGHGGQQVVAPQQALGTGVGRPSRPAPAPSSTRQRAPSMRERWSAGTRRTASAKTASARSNWRSSNRSSPSSRSDDSFIPSSRHHGPPPPCQAAGASATTPRLLSQLRALRRELHHRLQLLRRPVRSRSRCT